MRVFTIFDLLSHDLAASAARTCVIDGDRTFTFGDIAERVERLAGWLHHVGVERGDRIGIHLPKSAEEVVAILATSRIGAVFVDLSVAWGIKQVRHAAADCGMRVLFTEPRRAAELIEGGRPPSLEQIVVLGPGVRPSDTADWDALPPTPAAPPCPSLETDLAAIVYTSGSSGMPKGVMLSHRNFVAATESIVDYLGNRPDDRLLVVLSLSFNYGLLQLFTMLLVGGTTVLQRVVMPAEIAQSLARYEITGLAAVPPIWIPLVAHLLEEPRRFPSLRYITNAGGKCPDAVLAELPRALPDAKIFLMYGMTEALRTTYLVPELFHAKRGALGRAMANAEVYVVDASGRRCPPGVPGELVQRGATVAIGYWNNPAATAEKFRPCPGLAPVSSDERFCWSGDIVREDEDGYLWFVGRNDFMIKSTGIRISPTEVEEILYRHPGVRFAVAFGVPHERLGSAVEAAVVMEPSAYDSSALVRYCRKEMPSYMVPHQVHLWRGEVPRTGNGKIDARAVARAFTERREAV